MSSTAKPKFAFHNLTKASEIVGITTGRLRQLLRSGELKGIKAGPRAWLIPDKELAAFCKRPQTTGRPRVGKK